MTTDMDEGAGPSAAAALGGACPEETSVHDGELYFLIVYALSGGPLADLGETLAREATERGLLPSRIDYTGARHAQSFEQLRRRYSHLAPGSLLQALHELVNYRRTDSKHVSVRGVTSLLDRAAIAGTSLPQVTRAPLWTLPPASSKNAGRGLPPPQLLLLREMGSARCAGPAPLAPPATARLFQHHFTVRGHTAAAFCVAYDRTGRYVITGSDDRLVKVWSMTTGLLCCSCRGHDAELSDLSVSADNSWFASGAVDGSIRVWWLEGKTGKQQLGAPFTVLMGHSESISSVDFSPKIPHILVSGGFDGTVRLWDLREGGRSPLVLEWSRGAAVQTWRLDGALVARAAADLARQTRHSQRRQGPSALPQGADGADGQVGSSSQAVARGFTESRPRRGRTLIGDGRAGPSNNNHVVGTHAPSNRGIVDEEEDEPDEDGGADSGGDAQHERLLACSFSPDGRCIVAGSSEFCVYVWRLSEKLEEMTVHSTDEEDWPAIEESAKLEGHRNDVYLVQHSHDGTMLASGSADGTIRIWRRPRRMRRRHGAPTGSWILEATMACPPLEEEELALARQRRRQLPPPRVDQIAWTCDDSRLVATMQDTRVHVFSMPDGRLLHSLRAHTEPIHVLIAHPSDPAIVVSAAYSGDAIMWDVVQGTALKTLDSKNTRPDGRSWPDALPFVDGFAAPGGNGFVLTDVAGQLHCFGVGPRCPLTSRAPYDQFLSTDYEPLIRDLAGNVLSLETQMPAHVRTGRELLCDGTGTPYPIPFQEVWRSGGLLSAPESDAVHLEPGKQPGYLLLAPTLTAAQWRVYAAGGSEVSAQNAVARASARLAEHEALLDAGVLGGMTRRGARTDRGARRGAPQAAREGLAGETIDLAGASSEEASDREEDEYHEGDEYLGEEEDEEEEEEDDQGRGVERNAERDGLRHSQRIAQRQPHDVAAVVRSPSARDVDLRRQQRLDREARFRRRQAAHDAALERQRRRQERQLRSFPGRRRDQDAAPADGENGFIAGASSEEERMEGGVDDDDDFSDLSLESEESEGEEEYEGSPNARRNRSKRSRPSSRRRAERGVGARRRKRPRRGEEGAPSGQQAHGSARPRPSNAAAPRPASAYAWLALPEYRHGVYVPQVGDDAVYLREVHASVLLATSDNRRPPWQSVPRGRTMRPAEPCRVTRLKYMFAQDGSDSTAVEATLELSDPMSPLRGNEFTVDIPSLSSGHPEFLILRSRYDVAVIHPWRVGDFCLSYWQASGPGGDGSGGEWWRGTILSDKRPAGGSGVAADPMGCGGLWERFEVEWSGTLSTLDEGGTGGDEGAGASAAAAVQPAPRPALEEHVEPVAAGEPDISCHSPWELFPDGTSNAPPPPGMPRLDAAISTRVASAVEIAAQQDRWDIFQAAPEWNEAYRSFAGRSEYYNRRVPLPLGLMDVQSRLLLGYYRHREALEHDIKTLSHNAALFNGRGSPIAADARALERYLLAVVAAEGESPDAVDVMQYVSIEEEHGSGEEDSILGRETRRPRRQPRWYEVTVPDEEEPMSRHPAATGRSRGSSRREAPHTEGGLGSGRGDGRPQRASGARRVNYRDMEEGAETDGEENNRRTRVRGAVTSREPTPPQQQRHYRTRRAQIIGGAEAQEGGPRQSPLRNTHSQLRIRLRTHRE